MIYFCKTKEAQHIESIWYTMISRNSYYKENMQINTEMEKRIMSKDWIGETMFS